MCRSSRLGSRFFRRFLLGEWNVHPGRENRGVTSYEGAVGIHIQVVHEKDNVIVSFVVRLSWPIVRKPRLIVIWLFG